MVARAGDLASLLIDVDDLSVTSDVPMSRLTTWKTGGPASFVAEARSKAALREVLGRAAEASVEVLVVGNGSNLLVSDAGFSGVVLRLRGELAGLNIEGEVLRAGGGAVLAAATLRAVKASLAGLEYAVGIPGTVGGAVMTNASTFAGNTAEVLGEVQTVSLDGTDHVYESFKGGYREPLVPTGQVVTDASFILKLEEGGSLRERMEAVRARRQDTQPTGSATAGSVFKNPPGDTAGRLIDECGLKGLAVGGASVSAVHANFIVNNGGASSSDIKALMDLSVREVESRFGIRLEPEVRLIGFEEECSKQ